MTLDLRQDGGRARSVLLHRLALLGIEWGTPVDAGRTSGTFKEAWELRWRPELAVDVVLAGVHGTTVAAAAAAKVAVDAEAAAELPRLAELAAACLVADLPVGLGRVLAVLAQRSAQQHDAVLLLRAVEPLARTRRYGDVRDVDTRAIADVLDVIVTRAAIGLPAAVASLDDDRAADTRLALEGAQRGIALLDGDDLRRRWYAALRRVADQAGVHGTVQGRVVRLLLDAGELPAGEVHDRVARTLSSAADPANGAAWLDGFLAGDALLLLHDPELLGLVDGWLVEVGGRTFDDVLPLLRRAFARWEPAERRMLGERLRRGPALPDGDGTTGVQGLDASIDVEAARPAVAMVARLLGLRSGSASGTGPV